MASPVDTLNAAYGDSPMPLVVVSAEGVTSLVFALVAHRSGVAFVDMNWWEVGMQPLHMLRGRVTGGGPWRVGKAVVRRAVPSDRPEELIAFISRMADREFLVGQVDAVLALRREYALD
jgi:hypothetical protein